MVDWKRLLEEDARDRKSGDDEDDWRQEAADSLCELYYETYRVQKGRSAKRLDLRPGSDYRRFLDSHMKPLSRYGVWEALFPNRVSATSAQAIDEALHLLADTKLVDRVYSGDIVTVTKIVNNIQKKRGKYLELDGRDPAEIGDIDDLVVAAEDEAEPDDLELDVLEEE